MNKQKAVEWLKSIRRTSVFEEVEAIDMAIEALNERSEGKWIEHKWAEEIGGWLVSNYECSQCHIWERRAYDFCPNCGANMRGEKESEDE